MNQEKKIRFKYRIKYTKGPELRFVSHLDLMRLFQRAVRRAGLPIGYSHGFNPHQLMSFGNPLSLGMTSTGEYCDFEFEKVSFANQEELDAFNAKKRSLKDHTVKDFLYHTASELSAMDRVYQSILGKEAAEKVVSTAIAGFREKFGEEKTAALLEEAKQDFTVID